MEIENKNREKRANGEDAPFFTWKDFGYQVLVDICRHNRDKFGPLFPDKTPESFKAERIRDFERKVYPIWKPLHQRYVDGEIETEMDWIHEADWKIYRSDVNIDRTPVADKKRNSKLENILRGKSS